MEATISVLNCTKEELYNLMVEANLAAKVEKESPSPQENEILTRSETAKLFQVNVATLHRWTIKGKLKQYGIGGRTYYKRSEVLEAVKPLN